MNDDNDDLELDSFQNVLQILVKPSGGASVGGKKAGKKQHRDPRSVRLASVTSAVMDMIQNNRQTVSASQVYAKTVTALEGTLTHQKQQDEEQEDHSSVADSLATQVALLELLRVTLPHVQPEGILRATLPLTSRVLRALVASTQQADSQGTEVLETKDELGGVNAVLRGSCRAVAALLVRLEPETDHKAVQQLYFATLMQLWDDNRQKVRKEAQSAAVQVLVESNHPVLAQVTSKYFHSALTQARRDLQDSKGSGVGDMDSLLYTLALLEQCILKLDFETLSKDVMELLTCLFQFDATLAASNFVAMVKTHTHNSQTQGLMIQSLLAVVLGALDSEEETEQDTSDGRQAQESLINQWSSRVLATLLTGKPLLIFRFGSASQDILERGRSLYGHVVVASLERVLKTNHDIAYRVLPLSIQMVLLLSKPDPEDDNDNDEMSSTVSHSLLVNLSQLFRISLKDFLQTANVASGEWKKCEKTCLESLGALFRPEYQPCWSVGLTAVIVFLQQVVLTSVKDTGNVEEVKSCLEQLLRQHNEVPPGSPLQRNVEAAFSTFVQGVGIEKAWSLITWQNSDSDRTKTEIDMDRTWILATIKSAALAAQPVSPRLGFFLDTVLGMARRVDKLAATSKENTFLKAQVVELWSLLQCFCQHPGDVADTLPTLAGILGKALEDTRYPQLVPVISKSLSTLYDSFEKKDSEADASASALSEASQKLLPTMFKLVSSSPSALPISDGMNIDNPKNSSSIQHDGQHIQALSDAIAHLARRAPQQFLHGLFKKLMHKLLDEVQSKSRNEESICAYLSLSQALVASEVLDESSVSFLYRTLKPFIRSDESGARCQKKAYKVLSELCEHNHSFFAEVERLKEMTELLTSTAISSQIAARYMRLKCLKHIVDGLDGSQTDCLVEIRSVFAETLLCLKDTNAKTREAGYQLLLAIASKESMDQFLRTATAALGAETPHMRSAAVMALSRIVFEFGWENETLHSLLPSLLSTVLVLMNENSREVIKSVVGFIRISVAAIQREHLESMLPELMSGLLGYHKAKDRFRAKIKIILKKLVKQFGYDTLMPHVPKSETRLLTHMRKLDERQRRKKLLLREERSTKREAFDDMIESDEEDSDDGRTFATGMTGFTKMTGRSERTPKTTKTGQSAANSRATKISGSVATTRNSKEARHQQLLQLSNETDGKVVDMLGSNTAKRVKFMDANESDTGSDDGMEFDDEGRLVIRDDEEGNDERGGHDKVNNGEGQANKKRRTSRFESAKIHKSHENKKKQKQLGAAYKSKKAGGDVKRKDQQYEPFAFVPLSGKAYSKKNRRDAVQNMSSIVRQGKKRKQR